jgi:1-acyl-sn-glycerol-3-phosphate acyltransferase
VGEVFEIVQKGGRIDANARQALADEIMMRLAALMPNEMRGHYKDKDIVFTLTQTVKA